MALHVTQCPGCDSTFNTNARILQSAAGKVRCGACLTVFNAADNFIVAADTDDDADSSVFVGNNPTEFFDASLFITRRALTAPDPPVSDAGDFLAAVAAGLDTDTFTPTPEPVEPPQSEPTLVKPQEQPEAPAPEDFHLHVAFSVFHPVNHAPSPKVEEVPEVVSEFFEITEVLPEATPETTSATEQADSETDYDLIDVDTFDYVEVRTDHTDSTEHTDQTDHIVHAAETVLDAVVDTAPAPAIAADVDTLDESTEAIRARAFRAMLRDEDALEALPLESRTAIGKNLPPVELLSGREGHWGRRIFYFTACLLLSATLAAQFLWQQLPIYSRSAQWRPLYELACGIFPCTLPVYSEISAIRSDSLEVRSHATAANALTVSLSFRNTAAFPQPFPILVLSFNSATNAVIALREFAPGEYLDSDLRDLELMPVMSPVQIELDVMDPGTDAVNYTVAFRRP